MIVGGTGLMHVGEPSAVEGIWSLESSFFSVGTFLLDLEAASIANTMTIPALPLNASPQLPAGNDAPFPSLLWTLKPAAATEAMLVRIRQVCAGLV